MEIGEAWSLYYEGLTPDEISKEPAFRPPSNKPFFSGDEWADDLESKVWAANTSEDIKQVLWKAAREMGVSLEDV